MNATAAITNAMKQAEKHLVDAKAAYRQTVQRVKEEATYSLERFDRDKKGGYVDSLELNIGNMATEISRAAGAVKQAEREVEILRDVVAFSQE